MGRLIMNIFGKRLKDLRERHHMTQTEVANMLNYGYSAISNYESGRNEPSYSDLCKLANLFQVTVDYLVGNSELMTSFEGKYQELVWFFKIYESLDEFGKENMRQIFYLIANINNPSELKFMKKDTKNF